MRDEIDARIWVEHHDQFAEGVDRLLAALRSAVTRFAHWDGTSHQLIALAVSFLITALTFNTTTTA